LDMRDVTGFARSCVELMSNVVNSCGFSVGSIGRAVTRSQILRKLLAGVVRMVEEMRAAREREKMA
jgi:hypothetical protein